jgi:hypothetical protein
LTPVQTVTPCAPAPNQDAPDEREEAVLRSYIEEFDAEMKVPELELKMLKRNHATEDEICKKELELAKLNADLARAKRRLAQFHAPSSRSTPMPTVQVTPIPSAQVTPLPSMRATPVAPAPAQPVQLQATFDATTAISSVAVPSSAPPTPPAHMQQVVDFLQDPGAVQRISGGKVIVDLVGVQYTTKHVWARMSRIQKFWKMLDEDAKDGIPNSTKLLNGFSLKPFRADPLTFDHPIQELLTPGQLHIDGEEDVRLCKGLELTDKDYESLKGLFGKQLYGKLSDEQWQVKLRSANVVVVTFNSESGIRAAMTCTLFRTTSGAAILNIALLASNASGCGTKLVTCAGDLVKRLCTTKVSVFAQTVTGGSGGGFWDTEPRFGESLQSIFMWIQLAFVASSTEREASKFERDCRPQIWDVTRPGPSLDFDSP